MRDGPSSQFKDLAKSLADVVLPVPLGQQTNMRVQSYQFRLNCLVFLRHDLARLTRKIVSSPSTCDYLVSRHTDCLQLAQYLICNQVKVEVFLKKVRHPTAHAFQNYRCFLPTRRGLFETRRMGLDLHI